ncbi:MAG: DUF5011 domain-containing protein [Clostridia bacterium]|nr:DUF5011 domain-containing protein [Clostridia bacterium]
MANKGKHQKADRRWIIIVPLILLVVVCMCLLNREVIYKLNTKTQNLAVDAESESAKSSKNNPDSYWSEENEPVFYGATKITLTKDCIDEFNIKDSRFRIFARDFEDGDLTQNIIASGNVDVSIVGEYEITYRVSDSHSNEKVLVVPVSVVEEITEGTKESTEYTGKIVVERTLYTNPNISNIAGKANSEDMQSLGIYLPANTNVKVSTVSPTTNVVLTMVSNQKAEESTLNITGAGQSVRKKYSFNSIYKNF